MFEARVRSPMEKQTAASAVGKDRLLAASRASLSSFTNGQTKPQQTYLPNFMALTSSLYLHG